MLPDLFKAKNVIFYTTLEEYLMSYPGEYSFVPTHAFAVDHTISNLEVPFADIFDFCERNNLNCTGEAIFFMKFDDNMIYRYRYVIVDERSLFILKLSGYVNNHVFPVTLKKDICLG